MDWFWCAWAVCWVVAFAAAAVAAHVKTGKAERRFAERYHALMSEIKSSRQAGAAATLDGMKSKETVGKLQAALSVKDKEARALYEENCKLRRENCDAKNRAAAANETNRILAGRIEAAYAALSGKEYP